MTEGHLVARVVDRLAALGYTTATEVTGPRGRADLIVCSRTGQLVVVEFKIRDPLKAIGQLSAYAIDHPDARLVLAIPASLDTEHLRDICRRSRIDVWALNDWHPVAAAAGCDDCARGDNLCLDGLGLWEQVGRAHARGDLRGYARAIKAYASHVGGDLAHRKARQIQAAA